MQTETPAPPPSAAPAEPDEVRNDFSGLFVLIGLLVALGVFAGWGWALFVVAVIFMIFMHELGHYLTARWTGMKVTEFFIGFGPKIWSFQRGETEYGLKVIPAGAILTPGSRTRPLIEYDRNPLRPFFSWLFRISGPPRTTLVTQ